MTSTFQTPQFKTMFLRPKYWGIWFTLLLILPLLLLPLSIQFLIGKGIGQLFWQLGRRRRRDTSINLALCFPEKTDAERQQMAKDIFQHAGIGIFESLNAWFYPNRFPAKNVTIEGLETILQAQQQQQTVLVMGAHYTMLDLGALLCSRYFNIDIVYRPQNNALLEWVIYRLREPFITTQIDHHDMRTLFKSLKQHHLVWYTPDQDFGLAHAVMAPFFGVPAATITAQRRLAKVSPNTCIVAIGFYRLPNQHWWQTPTYHINITPQLLHYPSEDEISDATRVNTLLESLISKAPTQYMWFHRRFKSRPSHMTQVYK